MGVQVLIAGVPYPITEYSVEEDSTPLSSDDSSGSVGYASFTIKGVKDPVLLSGEAVTITDTRRGTFYGVVESVTEEDQGTASLTCISRLGKLNIYDVQAQPFSGTLGDLFRYYTALAQIPPEQVHVDPQVNNRPIHAQGWYGELWYYLKLLASAEQCEISLVEGIITLRPTRQFTATDILNTQKGRTYGESNLARAVEVYHYSNHPITNSLVYPSGGWTPETEVITVGPGATVERVLQLSASVTSIQPPVMQTFVSQGHNSSSVYTIVGDDGLPIQPSQWRDAGGSLTVTINDDTKSLTVIVKGPEGITGDTGEPISTFSVALGSDLTGNRYSTLRIVGSGVAFDQQLLRVRTMVPDQLTGTDVGLTIDNPFISSMNQAYSAGTRAAKGFAGESMSLSGSVTNIHPVNEVGPLPDDKVLGNAGGARFYDRSSYRWYRNRLSSIGPATLSMTLEDDLTYFDSDLTYLDHTYSQEQALFQGRSYSQRDRMGLRE